MSKRSFRLLILSVLLTGTAGVAAELEGGWRNPPPEVRLHAYWWWLNGNVTAGAITRDLEAMKEKGLGGALITDAGGANQDGNRQVPRGPLFGSEPWRELYRHALREGKRLNLEMALNIQSGWNLGGPGVKPDDAAKILCWTETRIEGPGPVVTNLPAPPSRHGLLRDIAVVAVRDAGFSGEQDGVEIHASSAHKDHPPGRAGDGDRKTFWVSGGGETADGALAWIRLAFDQDREVGSLTVAGRPGYGPKVFEVFAIGPAGERRKLADGVADHTGRGRVMLEPAARVRAIELRITDGYDPSPVNGRPRNVQIAEVQVAGPEWRWPRHAAPEPMARWEEKTLLKPVRGANYDTAFLVPARSDDLEGAASGPDEVVDLTRFADERGRLEWDAPAGAWRVYRFCYTVAPHARVSTCSEGWEGLAIDPMDPDSFQRYWDEVVEPLMNDAKALGGHTLKYLHTDSWEIEPFNWTAKLPEAFRQRHGYDLAPWLPVLARRGLGSREASERFLHDFRKTVAELVEKGYYEPFLQNAHRHGLLVRAESGGPHGVPIDAQHCLGMIDVPMSEFWATSWRHRVSEQDRFFVKQPASAAHTYGRKLVAAEGFTTIGPHWQETVWDNLKPNFDQALCEGMNQLVWTLVTCSPAEMGMPGQEMFPGTHFNPNSTWWRQSEGFLSYINRCQWMLQSGLFVADVLYYYGDHAPNFAGHRASNPAGLPAGYDYDVASEHVVLHRISVNNGRLVLPDGMSYAALVLPPHRSLSLPVLRKLAELAEAGAMIIGARPDSSSGLPAWQGGDAEARALINRMWGAGGNADAPATVKYRDPLAWLKDTRLLPDFVCAGTRPDLLQYIHRREGAADIYFVRNPADQPVRADALFRVGGRIPEFWDPCDGSIRQLPVWRSIEDGRIEVPLAFEAFGSGFVIFRKPAAPAKAEADRSGENFPATRPLFEMHGPWDVGFDSDWFYPDNGTAGLMVFDTLADWTRHLDPAVRHFSGTAVYRKTFDLPPALKQSEGPLYISLGKVHEMARVTLNGRALGIVWCPPWRVSVPADLLTETDNRIEIEVVNFWPNRLIGDTKLPAAQRRTRTNIVKFESPRGDPHYTTLMPSGLLGPVRWMVEER
jgi:hypothetical protein